MRTGLLRVLAAIAVVAVLIVAGVFVITNTDWGREQVRKRIVGILESNSKGVIKIGRISGNLLEGFIAYDVVITDIAGAPFADIDEVHA